MRTECYWKCYSYGDDLLPIFEFIDTLRHSSCKEVGENSQFDKHLDLNKYFKTGPQQQPGPNRGASGAAGQADKPAGEQEEDGQGVHRREQHISHNFFKKGQTFNFQRRARSFWVTLTAPCSLRATCRSSRTPGKTPWKRLKRERRRCRVRHHTYPHMIYF